MFGIGFMEIAVIFIAALVFIGPSRLPHVAHEISRYFVHLRRMSHEVRSGVHDAMQQAEAEIIQEERQKLLDAMKLANEEARSNVPEGVVDDSDEKS